MTIEWNAVMGSPEVIAVLETMLTKKLNTVEPTVDEKGGISYSVQGGGAPVSGATLEVMVKAGVLEKKSEGRLLCCPQHEGAIDLAPLLRCPHCNSLQLSKGSLLQHTCGFAGAPELFTATCPQCKKPSPSQTLKVVGNWYECESCSKRSALPSVFLRCKRFNHDFPIGQAKLIDQARYTLTAEAATAIKGKLGVIMAITNTLKAAAVSAEISGKMTGASGVQHIFDLIADAKGKRAPIDVRVGEAGPVDVVGILSTYAKALDAKATNTIVVAVPGATEDARKTAGAYGMTLIEGSDSAAIAARVLSSLGSAPAASPGLNARPGVAGVRL